jgi:tetratricopeptide (TPR) repeat protein
MRLPGSNHLSPKRVHPVRAAVGLLFLSAAFLPAPRTAAQQSAFSAERLRAHDSEQWREIESHLPDPATATPQALEMQADILRARRFPDDALDFYRFAMTRGANPGPILNKLGLTELEMRNVELARSYFKRAAKVNSKNADVWNNLGAVEYLDRGVGSAISDYKKAIKLDKHSAVFHANLATAYFETRDFNKARREMTDALKLDPGIFERSISTGGVEAHVLTSEDRARFAFEMAKLYAQNGQVDAMLHSLAKACEAGMDVQREMQKDPELAKFENDPRVVVLVHNGQMVRAGHSATVTASSNNGGGSPTPKPMSE